MVTKRVEGWTHSANGQANRRGRSPRVSDGFIIGTTMPTPTNVGLRKPVNELQNYAGSFNGVTEGQVIEDLIIDGQIVPKANGAVFRNCWVRMGLDPGGPSSGTVAGGNAVVRNWYAVDQHKGGGTDLRFEYCKFEPSTPTGDTYGIFGRHFTLYRCHITKVVDGVVGFGSSQLVPMPWAVDACLIDDLRYYSPDPRQSDNISHSDGFQPQGRTTIARIFGCAVYGGRTSAILIQKQAGNYDRLDIINNWLFGDPNVGSTLNIADGGVAIPNVTIKGNRISETGRPGPYRMLVSAATLNAATTIIQDNVSLETGAAVNASNGG